MEKTDKQVFKGFSKKAPPSKSASTAPGTAFEPRLNEPTDNVSGASLTDSRDQDAPVGDLWGLAFEKLSEEDKSAISDLQIKTDSKLDILEHLSTVATKKRNDCEAKRWKFDFHGRQIILRDVAQKIIVWVDKFKQIGDVTVNFDPVHALLPWAGVRFVLEVRLMIVQRENRPRLTFKQMTVAESQQMGALLTGVEKITNLISRCQIYEAFYLSRECTKAGEWTQERKQSVTNLTSALVALYATMLSFLGDAIRTYNQGAIIRTLCAILNPAKVIGFVDNCQSLENNLAIEAANCERIHARQNYGSSGEQIQMLNQILVDLQAPILRVDSRVAALCENLSESRRLNILQWISVIPYEENHFFACQGRTSGTGEWLLQDKRYREWRTSSASMILWLHGDRECHSVSASRRLSLTKSNSWSWQNEAHFYRR